MKIKLYKYTPHVEAFIHHPMLRATQADALNDPFELKPSQELIEFIIQAKQPSEDVITLLRDKESYVKYTMLWNKGVISLAECNDNLLMWAHYANEHKGGVIEFTFDIENKLHSRTSIQRGLFSNLADNNYQYGVVKYRKNRKFDTSFLDGNGNDLTNQIIDNLAFIKSKDWMYEEEHRFIINLNYCDITLFEASEDNRRELASYKLPEEVINGQLAVPPPHKFNDKQDSFLPGYNQFSQRSKNMQFTKVKESSVTGLYLGSKMPPEEVERIINSSELSKFKSLNNRIYRANLHSDTYDLTFEYINTQNS